MAGHFREQKSSHKQKELVLKDIEGKSARQIDQLAAQLWGQEHVHVPEKMKVLSPAQTQVTVTLDGETLRLLQELKARWSRKGVKDLAGVIRLLCEEKRQLIKKEEKLTARAYQEGLGGEKPRLKKISKRKSPGQVSASEKCALAAESTRELASKPQPSTSTPSSSLTPTLARALPCNKNGKSLPSSLGRPASRHIPLAIRRQVFARAGHACQYVTSAAKAAASRRCGSKMGLEIDHITPFSWGGTHELSNLRLLCRAHHARLSFKTFPHVPKGKQMAFAFPHKN